MYLLLLQLWKKLKGRELHYLVNTETLWLFEHFMPEGRSNLNGYFKLVSHLLWLEENFEENKKESI